MEFPERYINQQDNNAFSSYWKTTSLNLLPQFLPKEIPIKESEQWAAYYFQVDELGDQVAAHYLLQSGFKDGLNQLLNDFNQFPGNRQHLTKETVALFQQFVEIPHWVDFDSIRQGATYCNRCGTAALSVLRNYCLMGGYESSAINKPLIFTGSLKKGAVKRLSETVDFWMHLTETNGLQPRHNGIISILTTRMIHSFSRIMIEKQPDWKPELWGRPLNTWDMVATNLGFSIVFMDGLAKLKLPPTTSELKGTLHLWKYAGYLLGIPETLLPDTPEEASFRLYLWSKTQKGIDQNSKDLAYSLYEEPLKVSFTKNKLMKWFVQKTNLGYNEVLLGSESRKALGLPYSKAKYWILFLNKINRYLDKKAKSNTKSYQKIAARGRKDQVKVWELYKNV
ncbi:MAG TPA: oxygenase MpaB family protein [Flavobacterium sp.]|nr:oxygenase MpaB family protein [Flavobacterium sp.]